MSKAEIINILAHLDREIAMARTAESAMFRRNELSRLGELHRYWCNRLIG